MIGDRPNLILSPHFDDAVLSLGGFIAAAPGRAVVVTVFAGTPPDDAAGRWDRRSGFATAREAMRARAAENAAALAGLGVARAAICDLGHLDDQYRRRRAGRAAQAELQAAIAEDIRRQVRHHGGAVNLFAPVSGWHPDHRIVTDAVIDLARSGGCAQAAFFLYQDQPYAYLELRRKTLAPLRFAAFERLAVVARGRWGGPADAEFLEFSEDHLARKTAAIGAYKSQFRLINPALRKMIADFSFHQARRAESSSPNVEVAYRLSEPVNGRGRFLS